MRTGTFPEIAVGRGISIAGVRTVVGADGKSLRGQFDWGNAKNNRNQLNGLFHVMEKIIGKVYRFGGATQA